MLSITEFTCRVCLQEQEVLINIYDKLEDFNTNLSNLLETCADLQINEDDFFPKYLCEDCTRELLITSKFREKCSKSKEILNEISANTKMIEYEELSNSNDLIEYCTEDTNEIEVDYWSVHESSLDNDHYLGDLIQVIENVEQDTKSTVDKSLKCAEFNDQTTAQQIEDKAMPEDYSQLLQLNTENYPSEKENEYSANPVPFLNDVSFVAKSSSTKTNTTHLFNCDVCGALFKQAINLRKHIQKSHDSIDYFTCSKCAHCFSIETKYCEHLENCNHMETTTKEIIESNKSNYEKVFSPARETYYSRKCLYCERDFATPFALRMHLRTHTGERPFKCKYCTKSFKTQSQLNVHHKRHTGQADFVCSVCNKFFYEQSNLTVHMRSHTGERPHVCTVCNKTFNRVFLLQFHMRTHTGEKPFKCSYCDKSFRQHTDLRGHLTIHTGEKQHTCALCGKSYIKRSHLTQHMRKHQNHTNSNITVEESENERGIIELNPNAYNNQNSEINITFNDIIEIDNVVTHSNNLT